MRAQAYTIDVLLATSLLLLAVALLGTSLFAPSSERVVSRAEGSAYFLGTMKEAGILAEGIENQTALEEVLNNTSPLICADITLFEIKKGDNKGGGDGDNGDEDGKDKDKDKGKDNNEDDNDNGPGNDDKDKDKDKDKDNNEDDNDNGPGNDDKDKDKDKDKDNNEDDNDNGPGNDGGNGTSNETLKEIFTVTKEGCDYSLAENQSVSQFFSTYTTFKNNGKLDKVYLYRMRVWEKVS